MKLIEFHPRSAFCSKAETLLCNDLANGLSADLQAGAPPLQPRSAGTSILRPFSMIE
jgi:hypothetical protein